MCLHIYKVATATIFYECLFFLVRFNNYIYIGYYYSGLCNTNIYLNKCQDDYNIVHAD